jgi:hypothetical protein
MIPAAPGVITFTSPSSGFAKGQRIPPVGTLHVDARDAEEGSKVDVGRNMVGGIILE